jgi:phage tail sheath gpL-like
MMAISFNEIPSNIRIPFVTAEFDSIRAQQGPALLAYRGLIIGQKTGQGTALANSIHRVTNAEQVSVLAGRGSQLHRMAKGWFLNNTSTEVWIGVLDDSSASAFASGSIVASGTATASGTIELYIAGDRVSVAVASGDSAATIAAAIAAAIGVHAAGTVTMTTPTVDSDVTVAGVEFAGTVGSVVAGAATYSIDSGGATAAASLAAQINAHATTKALVRATSSSAVVTIRSIAGGTSGNAIAISTDDAVNATVSGATLSGGEYGDNVDLPVHASVSSTNVTLHARNSGTNGNSIDVRTNFVYGDETPAGVTLAITEPTGGTSAPTLTSLIAAMGDVWYHVIAHPYTDATSLTAIEAELARRYGPMIMEDGVAITSASGSLNTLTTLGDTRNSKHSVIFAQPGDSPLTEPSVFASSVAGVVAYYAAIDPARPLQTLEIKGLVQPAESDLFTNSERNLLLFDGIATTRAGADGVVQIERAITTYQVSAGGAPDTAFLDLSTVMTLMYARYSFRVRVANRYPRHKLANDGTRFGSGQAVMTPKLMRAECCGWFRELESIGLLEGFDQFKADLVVERNAIDPNRLDVLLSPNLINQFIVCAAKIQFLL